MRLDIHISQEIIAEVIGINVPKDYVGNIQNKHMTDIEEDWGIKVSSGLNPVFRELNIPLNEQYVHISTVPDWDFEKILKEYLKRFDVIAGVDYGALYNEPSKKKFGHAVLVKSIDAEKVLIFDPGPVNAGNKYVNADDLYDAMKRKKDGLWLIN